MKEIPNIDIYSDGGADPNPGKGGYGIILHYNGHKKELWQGYKYTTNNRMELMGVIKGLEALKSKSNVKFYSDSKYVIDGIEKGWAKKWKANNWFRTKKDKAQNIDLWETLLTLVEKHKVSFKWVKGHSGHPENERCDELATIAMNSKDLQVDEFFENENPCSKDSIVLSSSKPNLKNTAKYKIKNEGDLCYKCQVPVEKRIPKRKKLGSKQSYYFEYYFFCTSCNSMYHVEEAKRYVSNNNLFDDQ